MPLSSARDGVSAAVSGRCNRTQRGSACRGCSCERVQALSSAGVKCVLLQGSCRLCVVCGSQQSRRTSAHIGPGLLPPHGSRRAALHGLAGCDLPEVPGELFLLKASCASPNIPQSSCSPEQHRVDLSLLPSHIFPGGIVLKRGG